MSADTSTYPDEPLTSEHEQGDRQTRTHDTELTADALGSRREGTVCEYCAYLDFTTSHHPLKPKDIVGIPWMVAFALRADGWYLRQDIIWHKIAPMPESVTDRCTKSHEYVFLLAKSRQYFFDAVAIAEESLHVGRVVKATDAAIAKNGQKGAFGRTAEGFTAHDTLVAETRNKRDTWTLGPEPYADAHFAVMPSKLVEPCILAGTSEFGCCSECGAPWRRQTETSRTFESGSGRSGNLPNGKNGPDMQGGGETLDIRRGPVVSTSTTGWEPTCKHRTAPVVPAVVLDPFAGSGTVGKVALKHRRHAVLIELNADYCRLIEKRLHGVQVTLPFEEASA